MPNGIISIPLSALKDMLMLPEDYNVSHAYYDNSSGLLLIGVHHPDIPDTGEGNRLADIKPVYQQKITDDGRMISLARIDFYPSKGIS